MTTNRCNKPLFIIKTTSSDDNDVLMDVNSPTSSSKPVEKHLRSLSLPDCRQIYKDLTGAVHQSKQSERRLNCRKSHSFPSTFFLLDPQRRTENFRLTIESFSGSMNYLDATSGVRSPGDSSSRYSLYGSFFDLSECGFPTSREILPIENRPLVQIDSSTQLTSNTFEDKCNNWLNQIDENSR